ncbi:iron dicitrate transporter FecR [Bacteroidales bacterium]|nr:iron dicitrate transporter FecR [Bacteroidales bacterium]
MSIDYIISRVLSGEASSEDILLLSEWLSMDQAHKKEFADLKNYWDAEVSFNTSVSPLVAVEKLFVHVNEKKKCRRRCNILMVLAPLAASIMLLIYISSTFFAASENKNVVQYYTYLTSDNQTNLSLSDGTKVSLNKYSRLTYSDSYGKENRSVSLEGEAYFEVSSNKLLPFELKLDKASIEVVGTIFNVKSEAGAAEIKATLLEGFIFFKSPSQKVLLLPNQELNFNKKSNGIAIREVYAQEAIAWKDGVQRYKSISFKNLISQLETRYGVSIIINKAALKMPSVRVSGTFAEEQSLDNILNLVALSIPLKWTKQGDVYFIN